MGTDARDKYICTSYYTPSLYSLQNTEQETGKISEKRIGTPQKRQDRENSETSKVQGCRPRAPNQLQDTIKESFFALKAMQILTGTMKLEMICF